MEIQKNNKLSLIEFCKAWGFGILRAVVRKIWGRDRFFLTRYNRKLILQNNDANTYIKNALRSDSSFLVARFGDVELRAVVCYLERKLHLRNKYPEYLKTALRNNAGFFHVTEESSDEF